MTPAQLIQQFIRLRDHVEARTRAFEEELKPYQDGMKAIEGMVQQYLNDAGADNIKTEFGTAYKSTLMSVKLADRNAFEGFIVERPDGLSFFTNTVSKEKIKEYIDAAGNAPPGVDITYITKVNFRRS